MSSAADTSNGFVGALDVGERRIGVALASSIAKFPAPFDTVDRQKVSDIAAWIKDFVVKNSVDVLVVGLPRDMNGNETDQTRAVLTLVAEIEPAISIPIVMQDEAVTSIDAEARLKSRGKPYEKADIDAEAACIILQDYLDSQDRNTA